MHKNQRENLNNRREMLNFSHDVFFLQDCSRFWAVYVSSDRLAAVPASAVLLLLSNAEVLLLLSLAEMLLQDCCLVQEYS